DPLADGAACCPGRSVPVHRRCHPGPAGRADRVADPRATGGSGPAGRQRPWLVGRCAAGRPAQSTGRSRPAPHHPGGRVTRGGWAGRGAVVAFCWGWASSFPPALVAGGLIGAGIGAAFLLAFAGRATSGPSLILAGVAVSAIASALLALALTLAPNPFALTEITFWLMGGLADRPLWQIGLAAPPILLGTAILLSLGRGLDALSLG